MKFVAAVSILVFALVVPSYAKSLRADAVTDTELLSLSKKLHEDDVNGVVLTLDLQTKTTAGSMSDMSPGRLIVSDPTGDFANKPTLAAAQALLNNYQKNVTIQDTFTDAQLAEETAFIDTVMTTSVMQQVHVFLASKGFVTTDVPAFKAFLKTIWFDRYANYVPGVAASSGWEHTNVFERLQDNTIVGFHNWMYFFNEEEDGDTNYLGYIQSVDTGKTTIVSMPVFLYGSTKASTEINFGASPELELALGTLCFAARPDAPCFVQGSNGAIYAMDVHTVTINGVQYIESSHPSFSF